MLLFSTLRTILADAIFVRVVSMIVGVVIVVHATG
jgi:hypothetical protein